ncbi:unnamed protein product [Arctia plantaginis]|uniref:Uncharacterized protein n=1 Tax=Arctia plantaginis TaxID=874455 RepID=A0A8S0Z5L2_ARCPL|nr:unnamed protein product [Arctia plantaginis]
MHTPESSPPRLNSPAPSDQDQVIPIAWRRIHGRPYRVSREPNSSCVVTFCDASPTVHRAAPQQRRLADGVTCGQ